MLTSLFMLWGTVHYLLKENPKLNGNPTEEFVTLLDMLSAKAEAAGFEVKPGRLDGVTSFKLVPKQGQAPTPNDLHAAAHEFWSFGYAQLSEDGLMHLSVHQHLPVGTKVAWTHGCNKVQGEVVKLMDFLPGRVGVMNSRTKSRFDKDAHELEIVKE